MNTLSIRRRIKMTKGQQALYDLILDRIETGIPIELEDIQTLYVNTVCKDVRGGIPYYLNPWYSETNPVRSMPMSEWHIKTNATQWLSMTLGVLILKGKLTVMPIINIEADNGNM
jgi:hypothetical protein